MLASHQGALIAAPDLQILLCSGRLPHSRIRCDGGRSLRSWNLHAGWEILADIGANGASINDPVGKPIRTVAYSLLAFAAARLATEAYLLAIGDHIVHVLTSSFAYIPRHREGSTTHIIYRPERYGCVKRCHYIVPVNNSVILE